MRHILVAALAVCGTHAAQINCSSLLNTQIHGSTQIILATSLPAGSNFTGDSLETSYNVPQSLLPALCRVIFNVNTSPTSSALAEIWLPEPSKWTGRFLAAGNSGFAGGINYPDMAWGVRKGFATMSTNTGHDSTSGDGTWMLNEPEKMIDFGHRALHLTTIAAKDIVAAYYGTKEEHSYYAGCSTAGRQGLNAAQRYPEDYDGVLVGSAIAWQTHTSAWQTYVALHQYPNTRSAYIPASAWEAIHEAVLSQCADQDGIIMNPARCDFHPEVLLCGKNSNTTCLTAPQIENLKRMYRPWLDTDGTLINPGISVGGETSFSSLMNSPEPLFGPSFYRYAVFNDSSWDWRGMNISTVEFADAINPGGMNAYDASGMRRFQQTGGKVMQYHGFADPLIPAMNAGVWFDEVQAYFEKVGAEKEVGGFFRLFMVPGMGHCSGGVGAWVLDGPGQGGAVPEVVDGEHSLLWSLTEWVESGKAPERIVGTKFANDTQELGVEFMKPVCRWPMASSSLVEFGVEISPLGSTRGGFPSPAPRKGAD